MIEEQRWNEDFYNGFGSRNTPIVFHDSLQRRLVVWSIKVSFRYAAYHSHSQAHVGRVSNEYSWPGYIDPRHDYITAQV